MHAFRMPRHMTVMRELGSFLGAAVLVLGTALWADANPVGFREGSTALDQFGFSLSGGGDANGDGIPDLLVGAPGSSMFPPTDGMVHLLSGRGRALAILRWSGTTGRSVNFGQSVSFTRDVNGDGAAEIVVASRSLDGLSGAAGVYTAAGTRLWQVAETTSLGPQGLLVGDCVVAGIDADGDGRGDVALGLPRFSDPPRAGGRVSVYSVSGNRLLWSSTVSAATGSEFGRSMAAIRDIDGDGAEELVVGDPGRGRVTVHSGRTGAILMTLQGDLGGDRFGASVAAAGDVDGDGVRDIAVGAPMAQGGRGRAYAFSGATGQVIYGWTGTADNQRLGTSVAHGGDANGDGRADILAGAIPLVEGPAGAGAAFLFDGRTGALMTTVSGILAGDRFGATIVGGVDFDQRGTRTEFVVGAPGYDGTGGLNTGAIFGFNCRF